MFRLAAPSFQAPRATPGTLSATWIGHATLLLQVGDKNILTDPMFGERASPVSFAGPRRWVSPGVALADLPPVDVVLLSHNHYDHLHVGSIRALANRWPDAQWFVPLDVDRLVGRAGVAAVTVMDWWDGAVCDGLDIMATPAQHFSSRTHADRDRTLWCGFTISTDQFSVYFAGDTGYFPEFGKIADRSGPFDLALLPIGAYEPRWFMRPVHMNPEEAVRAFVDIGGRAGGIMGGIHWGTFKLTDEPMDEPPRRARAAWAGAELPEERLWIPRHGETKYVSADDKG